MKSNNHFHILVVDDEAFNVELASVYLKEEGYNVSFALNAKGAIASVMKKDIDLILLDINMPKVDGFEVCKILKSDEKMKNIPVVFLTAQTDIEYISRAFEVGGIDYIAKPFNGVELKVRVKTHLQNVAYLDEIKLKQSKLAQLSITDTLSKLYNSFYFDSQLKAYQKKEENFWFVYIKINNFDKMNSIYGFSNANKIIRIFAKILQKVSPANAVVAKLYGVSFAVLMNDYEHKVMKKLYENLFLGISKNKELANILTFSLVLYNVTDRKQSISSLYKKVQVGIEDTKHAGSGYLFLK